MIFDNDKIRGLVKEWKSANRDPSILLRILEDSKPLLAAIVRRYGYCEYDDLMQEALITMTMVVERYDENISKNLYGYVVRAINNRCITYIRQFTDEQDIDDEQIAHLLDAHIPQTVTEDDTLRELLLRNRERFPSLSCIIDEATEFIYYKLKSGIKQRVIYELMDVCGMSRAIATVVYHSTVIYLRYWLYRNVSIPGKSSDIELTLLPDVQFILDNDDQFVEMRTLLAGMYVKFPS